MILKRIRIRESTMTLLEEARQQPGTGTPCGIWLEEAQESVAAATQPDARPAEVMHSIGLAVITLSF